MEEGGDDKKDERRVGIDMRMSVKKSDEEGGDRYDSDSEENDEMTNSTTRRCDIDM